MKKLLAMAGALLLSACSIQEHVVPVAPSALTDRTICIIEHPETRATFLTEYRRQLETRGYQVRMMPPNSSTSSCPTTTTYFARWSWDFTIYMAFADIRVYSNGSEIGRATYDSRAGGFRSDKWIDAEQKIADLVEQLFPRT
jgi:hypothetical protein